MFNKLNGWLRIWLLLSVIWVVAMMLIAIKAAGDANRNENSIESFASSKEELRSEINQINPAKTPLSPYEDYLRMKSLGDPAKDPYVDQECRRAIIGLDKFWRRIYEARSRATQIPIERLIPEPESVKYYKQLIEAYRWQASLESSSRDGAAMYRKRMWVAIAAGLVTPFVLLLLSTMVIKVIRWISRGFNLDKASALPPAVFQSPAPAQAMAAANPAIPVIEAPTPVEVAAITPVEAVAISPGFSYTATVWVTGILLVINGFITLIAYESMQSHSGSRSLTTKPGGLDILLGCVLMIWRSKRTIYLPWAFWRAAIGLVVMPILAGLGFLPTTALALIGYGMACVGLMTLTYNMKTPEDRLSMARTWTGTSLVMVGWIVGFVQL